MSSARWLEWFPATCLALASSFLGCSASDTAPGAASVSGFGTGGGANAAAGSSGHPGGATADAGATSSTSGASAVTSGGTPANGGGSTTTTAGEGGSAGSGSSNDGGSSSAGAVGSTSGSGGAGGALVVGGAGGSGAEPDPNAPFVFSTFGDASRLLIYTSTDALSFKLLSDTGYAGPSGTLRDPSIMKYSDGKFYVAFTTPPTASCCGAESSFSLASSADLVHWTTLTTVKSGIDAVVNTWAPEWFKDQDGTLSLIVNIDTNEAASFRTYQYKAQNAALTAFSGPTAIGIGPNYIDTFIVIVGGTYHAFTKNETTLYIEHATAPSVTGPWTFVGKANWAGWGPHREAPALIHLPNGTWRIYVDGGSQGHEMYSDSKDTFTTWTALKALPVISASVSHGTVIQSALP